jgi:hypothetical protein
MYPSAVLGPSPGGDEYTVVDDVLDYWPEHLFGSKPTNEQIAQNELAWRNSTTWAAQAAARKDREAKVALALPDSDDPTILRRKLNAALHLIGG